MAAKKTPKKTSSKKKGSKPAFGAKAEFIRRNSDLTASEVVAKAAEAGLQMTANHVYNVRSAKAKKGKTRGAAKAVGPAPKAKTVTNGRRASASSGASTGTEAALRDAIAELGLKRAREVFAEIEAAIRGRKAGPV